MLSAKEQVLCRVFSVTAATVVSTLMRIVEVDAVKQ